MYPSVLFLFINMQYKILQEFIKTEANRLNKNSKVVNAPEGLASSIPWRKTGLKYTKNECYLDVIEKLHLLVGSNGQTISSNVKGQIQMKSFLSGMPELRLGLNDKTFFELAGKNSKRPEFGLISF